MRWFESGSKLHALHTLRAVRLQLLKQRLLCLAGILGQREIKGRAFARFAFGPDLAAVAVDEVFDNRKPQPGAALFTRACFVHTVKSLEHPLERSRGNPRTVVGDKHFDLAAIHAAATNGDGAAIPAIFDRVIHEVAQNLLEPAGVGAQSYVGRLVQQLGVLGSRPGLEVGKHAFYQRMEGDGLQVEYYAAGFEGGNRQQVFDEQAQSLGVAGDGLEEFDGDFRIVAGAVQEGLDIALDERERRAQFMAYVSHESRAGRLQLVEAVLAAGEVRA